MTDSTLILRGLRRLENARSLDAAADVLRRASAAVTAARPARDILQGRQLGHPVHAALAMAPVGAWMSSILLSRDEHGPAARTLLRFALLSAPVVGLGGVADAGRLDHARRRVAVVHAASNAVAGTLGAAALARSRAGGQPARLLSWAGLGALMAGGFLGGHLASRLDPPPPPSTAEDRPLGQLVSADEPGSAP